MDEMEYHEASGVVAFLIDSLTCHNEIELGQNALYGLNVILHALDKVLQRADRMQHH